MKKLVAIFAVVVLFAVVALFLMRNPCPDTLPVLDAPPSTPTECPFRLNGGGVWGWPDPRLFGTLESWERMYPNVPLRLNDSNLNQGSYWAEQVRCHMWLQELLPSIPMFIGEYYTVFMYNGDFIIASYGGGGEPCSAINHSKGEGTYRPVSQVLGF